MDDPHQDPVRDLPLSPEMVTTKELLLSAIEDTLNLGKEKVEKIRRPILIFETDPLYRNLICNILMLKNYDIKTIESKNDFKHLYDQQTPIAVIINIDRFAESAHWLIENHPSLPVIALTGQNENNLAWKTVVHKPFVPSEFMKIVHQMVPNDEKLTFP